jgi:tetratricopeptide (TPR) repeat protein
MIRAFAVLLFLGALGGLAMAGETQSARHLYDQGLTDYNLSHYDEALASFEKAYRIKHDPAFLFNIGQCQRQLHRYEDAERSYRAFLRESPNTPKAGREQVQKLVADMEKAVADERAKQPPTGTEPPSEAVAPAPASSPSLTVHAELTSGLATKPTVEQRPLYKKWWLWTIVGGVVAAGAAAGIAVVLTRPGAPPTANTSLGTQNPF